MPPVQRSSAEIAHEREVLEEMVRSEGWQVFVDRCAQEWVGIGFHHRIGAALQSSDPLDVKVVYRTSLEIQRALQYPVDRIKHLRGQTK